MVLLLATLFAVAAPIGEGDARAVVDRWLAAQNAGDFTAYEKLFAARFTGIRRSGPRTVRFERAGWMRDRARMFKKPMLVTVSDLRIRAAGASAVASFTQTFVQGSYKDAGPKQLVVVREAGALAIASETMLRSTIETQPVPADERFRFVVSDGLLLSDSPQEQWAAGAPKYQTGSPIVSVRSVDAAKLPAELARWRGRRVRILNAAGSTCDAKVTGFRLLSRSIPHFGMLEDWRSMKEAEAAQQAWDLGKKELVGEIDTKCGEAFWGQPAGPAVPDTDPGEPADAALRARAIAQLHKSAAWKQIQKSYVDSEPGTAGKRWDEDGAVVEVRQFRARRGGKAIQLVSVTAAVAAGCEAFNADLWALYEKQGDKLIPRNTPGKSSVKPIAAVDSDGDGNSELLFTPGQGSWDVEKGRLLLDGELWDQVEEVSVPYMDCPC